MAGRYGMSFAAKLTEQGKYAEAIEEASRAAARDDEDPAPLVERAAAYAWLERYPEAVQDLEAALALDQTAGVLETDVVDDAYFSALLGRREGGGACLDGGGRRYPGAVQDDPSRRPAPDRRRDLARTPATARPGTSEPRYVLTWRPF